MSHTFFVKNYRFILSFILIVSMAGMVACSASKESAKSNNFIAPGYVKKEYKKILVLVRVDPDIFRKRIEKSMLSELKDRKYNAAASYEFVTVDMMKDTLALRDKVKEIGFDAALVLTYLGEMTGVTDNYQYNGNIYSVFYGAYPTYDLDTRSSKTAYFQADFYCLDGKGTQWRTGVPADISGDPDRGLATMSETIRKRMETDNIL
jgi:hypothetical protein